MVLRRCEAHLNGTTPFRPDAAAAAREQEATQAAAASLEATQRLRTAMGSGRLALT